jgi:hypothetical protein
MKSVTSRVTTASEQLDADQLDAIVADGRGVMLPPR